MNDFSGLADDFFINVSLQTALALSDNRETVLHFAEAVQREFTDMTSFYQRETGEYVLEGDHDSGCYQWLELQPRRIAAGSFNPGDLETAYRFGRWLLDRSVYFLGVSGLDVDCLDLMFGFNLDFVGNRDAIVAEALMSGSPLGAIMSQGAHALEAEPSIVIALDGDCTLQARLSIETRSSSYQVRTGHYEEDPISVYLTLRRYPHIGKVFDIQAAYADQCRQCEDFTSRIIVPNVIQPIAAAIASSR